MLSQCLHYSEEQGSRATVAMDQNQNWLVFIPQNVGSNVHIFTFESIDDDIFLLDLARIQIGVTENLSLNFVEVEFGKLILTFALSHYRKFY